jgi:hypothetical protein
MSVYFCNAEPIDLNTIRLMGVSVKNGPNPIGYFGTGLKFSIATLLRLGGKVALHTMTKEENTPVYRKLKFAVQPTKVRGEEFGVVAMGDEPLGFTTALGRNWEAWQAYRELASNTMDEGGEIIDHPPARQYGTVIEVSGDAIEGAYRQRDAIFISGTPLAKLGDVEIHRCRGALGFYRGVCAHTTKSPPLFSYNVTSSLDLTEDRTVKSPFMFNYRVAAALPKLTDRDMLRKILLAPMGTFESDLDYGHCDEPGAVFMEVVRDLQTDLHLNPSARKLYHSHAGAEVLPEAPTDAVEDDNIERALALCARLHCHLTRADFKVVESLGVNVRGAVRDGQILISRPTLDMGYRHIASTLYEEWLHKTQGLVDESRSMQNFLFERLFACVERLPDRAAVPDDYQKAEAEVSTPLKPVELDDEIPF